MEHTGTMVLLVQAPHGLQLSTDAVFFRFFGARGAENEKNGLNL
jgi:hypothetical protein